VVHRTSLIALMAACVSAYAVSSTFLAPGVRRIASSRKRNPVHFGHALVGHQQRHRVVASDQPVEYLKRRLARVRSGRERSAPQVPLHGPRDLRVVVDGQHRRLAVSVGHRAAVRYRNPRSSGAAPAGSRR
jgi:hypothetical protein